MRCAMSDDVVDVLIVGAGSSGAAVAWSLAETRMHVVCASRKISPRQSASTTASTRTNACASHRRDRRSAVSADHHPGRGRSLAARSRDPQQRSASVSPFQSLPKEPEIDRDIPFRQVRSR